MIVHLLRHAKSSWTGGEPDDRDRPLAPRGERATRELSRHLAAAGVRPSLALCSPALRARQTLEALRGALPAGLEVRVEERLYAAGAAQLLARLRRLPRRVPEVLLVGHNPALHELALILAGDAAPRRLRERLPTGALVTLEVPGASWRELGAGAATAVAMWRPRSDLNRRSPP